MSSPECPSPGRSRLAVALYAGFAFGLLAVAAAVLSGGTTIEEGPLRLSLTSWRGVRLPLLLLFLGLWVDPERARRLQVLAGGLERHPRLLLWGGLGLAALYLTAFKVTQHLSFRTGAYDLSMLHHAVHNTVGGPFLHAFGIERSFFSEHFSPVLLLLVPPYVLFPSPLTLLVIQSLAVALAAVPLYALCRHEGLSRGVSALVGLLFLANGRLWAAHTFDFHMELFTPLAVFLAGYAMAARRWPLFYAALLLALSIKEDMAIVMGLLGVLLWVRRREDLRHAAVTWAACAIWALVAFKGIIPASHPDPAGHSHFVTRYAHLGDGYSGILWGLLTSPGYLAGLFVSAPIRALLGSVAGLPLLDPVVVLLAVLSVLVHLASGYEAQANLVHYYSIAALSLLFLGVPRGLARLRRWRGPGGLPQVMVLALAIGVNAPSLHPVTRRDRQGHRLLAGVPGGVTVSAQTSLLPHLLPSRALRLFPRREGAEWILLDLRRMRWPLEHAAYTREVEGLLRGGEYGVATLEGGFLFLARGHPTARNPEALLALGEPP